MEREAILGPVPDMPEPRAYALLHVKSIDASRRWFAGVASTPELDRQGHSVDPAGVTFTNPLPLLLHHDQTQPIGQVVLTKQADGIAFEATLPVLDTPGRLKDRIDEAWDTIKTGLMTGVSIGYRVLNGAVKRLKAGGLQLLETEIIELSLVTIPANTQASIRLVKSLAASGRSSIRPGGAGLPVVHTESPPMAKQTTAEQIRAFEATRAAKSARLVEIMEKANDDHVTLDAEQTTEYDDLKDEVTSIDAHLTRLHELEQLQLAAARPVTPVTSTKTAGEVRATSLVTVKADLPADTLFLRYTLAKLAGKGSHADAMAYAARFRDSTPEVELALKAAVPPATTTDPTWMGALVPPNITRGFIELLRASTLVGRIPNLYNVPFNVTVPTQTGGGTYSWVGETAPKPVTKFTLGSTSLGMAKIAAIIALSEELTRLSVPSAEEVVRREMTAGITAFMDQQFIDPTVAAVTGVSPASITNGITPITTTGDPVKDITAILVAFATAGVPVDRVVLIMSSTNAFHLGLMRTAFGAPVYPNLGPTGGTVNGIPVIASNTAGANVIGVAPEYILYADEGGVTIDVSREASIQMNSTPDNPTLATSVLVSLWQNNLVGIRAERYCNWKRAMTSAVQYVGATAYPLAEGVTPHSAPAKKA